MRDLSSESQTKTKATGIRLMGLKPSRLTGTFVPGFLPVLIRTAEIHDGPNSLRYLSDPCLILFHRQLQGKTGHNMRSSLGDQKKNMIENGSAAEDPRRIVNTVQTGKVSVPTGSGPLHAPAYRCVDKGRRPG